MLHRHIRDVLVILCLLTSTNVFADKSIKIVTTHWPPYTIENQETDFIREVIKQAYAHSDTKVEFVFLPWVRALEGVKKGIYDGIAPAYMNAQRLKDFTFSAPMLNSELVLMYKGEKRIMHEVTDKVFGVVRGYVNASWIDDSDQITKLFAKSDEHNLTLLEKGRTDICVIDKRVADYIIEEKKWDADTFHAIDPAISYDPMYLAFSIDNPNGSDLVNDFNSGLLKIIFDHTLFKLTEELLPQ